MPKTAAVKRINQTRMKKRPGLFSKDKTAAHARLLNLANEAREVLNCEDLNALAITVGAYIDVRSGKRTRVNGVGRAIDREWRKTHKPRGGK